MELDFKVLAGLLEGAVRRRRSKYLGEFLEAPFVVFARVVAGEIGGCDIRDCFGVDAYYLGESQFYRSYRRPMGYHTFRRRVFSCDMGSGAMVVAVLQISQGA